MLRKNTLHTNSRQYVSELEKKIKTAEDKLYDEQTDHNELKDKYQTRGYFNKILAVSTVVLGLTAAYLGFFKDNNQNIMPKKTETKIVSTDKQAPEFFYVYHTPGDDNTTIFYPIFTDNNALGMKAYAQHGQDIYTLVEGAGDLDDKGFRLPKELIEKNGSFDIWAIDRAGNQSAKTTLYTFKGYVSDKPIPQ